MNKDTIIQILTLNTVELNTLNEFIAEYVHDELHRDPTKEELAGIVQAIQSGLFDLRYAATRAAQALNLYVMNIFDKNGVLLKTHVYENW